MMRRLMPAIAALAMLTIASSALLGAVSVLTIPRTDTDYSRAALHAITLAVYDENPEREYAKLEAFRQWSKTLPDRKLAWHYTHWIDIIELQMRDAHDEAAQDARIDGMSKTMPTPANP